MHIFGSFLKNRILFQMPPPEGLVCENEITHIGALH